MVIKKACIDQNLAHEYLKSQIFAPRTENNKEMVIMDKLLVPPLTLHHLSSFSGSSWPILTCITIYHRLTDSFQLPLASGNSLMPTYDCSK